MSILEANLVGRSILYLLFSPRSMDSDTHITKHLVGDGQPMNVEHSDTKNLVKLEHTDELIPKVEDPEKDHHMLGIDEAGL